MNVQQAAVLYLHGFNSSPDSKKACQFREYCEQRKLARVYAPALPYDPALALALIDTLAREENPLLVVGSSLGGFYATWLCERYGMKAALVNPAVVPFEHLDSSIIGPQKNYYTGEQYEFTLEHVQSLRVVTPARAADPTRYMLLVQTGDEVLDYRLAVDFYLGSEQHVQPGGNHSFENFEAMLPAIFRFAGLE